MSDRNLYFQMLNNNRQQRKLQRPLLRGNYLPERENNEPFYGNAIIQKHQLSFGGADKNLFFQIQEKGKVRLVPFMLKRQFKDLEPGSRIIGSLDTTKEERQASSLVKGIQNISSLLNSFLSEPETDSVGNIVLDSDGSPKYKTRSMQDQLLVARDAIKLMLQQVQVPINDNQSSIIDTFDVDDSKSILSKAENVISHSSWDEAAQEEKSSLMDEIIINEAIQNLPIDDDKELSESELADKGDTRMISDLVQGILQNSIYTGDLKKDGQSVTHTKKDWYVMDDEEKNDLFKYIIVRKYMNNLTFRNYKNYNVEDIRIRSVLGQAFKNDHVLDLDNMRMRKKITYSPRGDPRVLGV